MSTCPETVAGDLFGHDADEPLRPPGKHYEATLRWTPECAVHGSGAEITCWSEFCRDT